MYRNKLLIFVSIWFAMIYSSSKGQNKETCESSGTKEEIFDLNSVTKCAINDSKDETSELVSRNSKRVSFHVSTSRRRRIVRKRNTATSTNIASSTNKLNKIKNSISLVENLSLANRTLDKLPFNFVEEKPFFDKCKDTPIKEQSKCFSQEMLKHIKRNFKYPSNSYNKSIQGRVLVRFVIDENGNVGEITTRGPLQGEELEAEARRIIKHLPKLNPGKINDNPIKVKHGVSISFKIPDRKPSNVIKKANENVVLKGEVINFSKVQHIPLFKACKTKVNEDAKLDCFNSEMAKHVKKYFAYPEEAMNNGVQGRVYAYFVIDKEGDVVNVKTRGPKNGWVLESTTKKLVLKLPKFIPGKQDGKTTNVKYAFPINFKLN